MSEKLLSVQREEQIKAIYSELSGDRSFVSIGELANALYGNNLTGVRVNIIGDEERQICTIAGKPSLEVIDPWKGTQQPSVPVILEHETKDGIMYTSTTISSKIPVQVIFSAATV